VFNTVTVNFCRPSSRGLNITMANLDFPFDVAFRPRGEAFAVCAYTRKGKKAIDDICGPGIEWFEHDVEGETEVLLLARLTPSAEMGGLAAEALRREVIVGLISPDVKRVTRYVLSDDGTAFVHSGH
jgi:hypothetical protein